jgi:hypothetical protein
VQICKRNRRIVPAWTNVTIWCARFGVNFGEAALAAPMSMPVKVAEGSFRGVAHETKGTASIYWLPDGKQVLRFSGFQTSNAPDVHIYLVAAADAKDDATVKNAGFIDLGQHRRSKLRSAGGRRPLEVPSRHRVA